MKINELKKLIRKSESLAKKISFFEKKKLIKRQQVDRQEIFGHIEKTEHNLQFVRDNMQLDYLDWSITGCYYAIYHMALALILAKGYSSKNHDATLCILIKEYYKKGIEEKDIELINFSFINYQDLLFYIHSKNKREEASYSTKYLFDKNNVEKLTLDAINFIDKAKNILKNLRII